MSVTPCATDLLVLSVDSCRKRFGTVAPHSAVAPDGAITPDSAEAAIVHVARMAPPKNSMIGPIDESLLPTNQKVGSSNLSGRAIVFSIHATVFGLVAIHLC